MSQVVATAERIVRAPAERVRAALADYEGVRAADPARAVQRLPGRVRRAGRRAPGSHWRFAATSKRVREQVIDRHRSRRTDTLVETDENSSMVTTWTVHPADAGGTTVRVRTTWHGAGGIGGLLRAHLRAQGAAPGLRPRCSSGSTPSSPPADGGAAADSRDDGPVTAAPTADAALAATALDGARRAWWPTATSSSSPARGCPPTPASPTTGARPAACAGTPR